MIAPAAFSSSTQASTVCKSANGVKITDPAVCKGLKYYAGKTINFVGLGPAGNPFDLFARAEAPLLQEYLGATVDVTDYPLGNTTMGQDLIASSASNGLTLGALNELSDVASILTNTPGLNFNPEHVDWVASSGPNIAGIEAHTGSYGDEITKFSQINSTTHILTRTSGTDNTLGRAFLGIMGITPVWVTGYSSAALLEAGFTRGDGPLDVDSSTAIGPNVVGGLAVPIAINAKIPPGENYRAALSVAPTFDQLIAKYAPKTKSAKKQIAAFNFLNNGNGTPVAMPTGTPSDDLATMRAAFEWFYTQPSFKSELNEDALNDTYVNPVTAKSTFIQLLKKGKLLSQYMVQ
jgi:hypothetical protein